MKLAKHKFFGIFFIVLLVFSSCNEEEFLEETPLDFLSPENSFNTPEGFESSLIDLYAKTRDLHFSGANNHFVYAHFYGTDIFRDARKQLSRSANIGDYNAIFNPTNNMILFHWQSWYKVIANANTVINKVRSSELEEVDKNLIEAEARLFRSLAYRYLVYLYGGVPIVVEEITEPKADFTRASKEEVLNQIVNDALFAANNLPAIDQVQDGRLSNLVAQHILAETYIVLEQWQNAIDAASIVINDPNTALMNARFGSRASDELGDVYWDLFRVGNQNRSVGNTEAIWVAQMENDVIGGYLNTSGNLRNILERMHVPALWLAQDPNGDPGVLGPRSDANIGGRGVSFLQPTDHFENTIWATDFDNDIRNSDQNYVREIVYDNPESSFFGQSMFEFRDPRLESAPWRLYPFLTKVTTPQQHPSDLFLDPAQGILNNGAGSTYRDMYYIRLAETYLLRAEAYLGNGNSGAAADDINLVRARSSASPIGGGEVTIDYILDERARELSLEEQRRITLSRVGKLVERVRLYNDWNGPQIQDFHSLFPIPDSEIQANINGNLEQNPGY